MFSGYCGCDLRSVVVVHGHGPWYSVVVVVVVVVVVSFFVPFSSPSMVHEPRAELLYYS